MSTFDLENKRYMCDTNKTAMLNPFVNNPKYKYAFYLKNHILQPLGRIYSCIYAPHIATKHSANQRIAIGESRAHHIRAASEREKV